MQYRALLLYIITFSAQAPQSRKSAQTRLTNQHRTTTRLYDPSASQARHLSFGVSYDCLAACILARFCGSQSLHRAATLRLLRRHLPDCGETTYEGRLWQIPHYPQPARTAEPQIRTEPTN